MCRLAFSKRFENFRRLISQVEREGITLELFGAIPTEADFQLLTQWKADQFQRSGLIDLISKPLTMSMLKAATDQTMGYMVRLAANGELVAGHFGIRSATHFHPWIAAY